MRKPRSINARNVMFSPVACALAFLARSSAISMVVFNMGHRNYQYGFTFYYCRLPIHKPDAAGTLSIRNNRHVQRSGIKGQELVKALSRHTRFDGDRGCVYRAGATSVERRHDSSMTSEVTSRGRGRRGRVPTGQSSNEAPTRQLLSARSRGNVGGSRREKRGCSNETDTRGIGAATAAP